MISSMVIRNLFEENGRYHSPVCVEHTLVNLETSDVNQFYNAACDWLEDNYDLNTDDAKIDTYYTRDA